MTQPAVQAIMSLIFKQSLSLPRLPAELTDMVIDYLQSDPTTLCTTCLVCRSWLPRSRLHLFRQLSISVPRRKRFDALVGFLRKSPHIARRVKELELYGPQPLSDEHSQHTAQELPPVIPATALATLLTLLSSLSELHLFDISFWSYNLRESKLQAPLPRFKLDLLAMHRVGSSRDTTDHVMRVLNLFSEIKFLHLGSTVQRVDGRRRLLKGLKVSSLRVEDVPCDMYLDAMRELELGGRLEFLESQAYRLEDVRSLANLVENTTSRLWHLGISVTELFANPSTDDDHEPGPQRTDPEEVLTILAPKLALCNALEWLSICIPFAADDGGERSYTLDAWRFLIDLIPAIPSSVPWVTVCFVPCDGSLIEDAGYNWTELSIAAEPFLRREDALLDLKYSPLNGPGKNLDLAELRLLIARK